MIIISVITIIVFLADVLYSTVHAWVYLFALRMKSSTVILLLSLSLEPFRLFAFDCGRLQ
jgi:hypothetical protein